MKVRKAMLTGAIAVGLVAGSAGLANAASAPGSAADDGPNETQEPSLNGSLTYTEVEGTSESEETTALAALATISAEDAAASALAANAGSTLGEVSLGNENGSIVYEVELTNGSGVGLEVKVDAGSGAVLAQETEDDSDDESGSTEQDDDAVEHEFEGEETGDNGDGIPDADDVNEAPEVTPGS